jgi:multidrug transporter EmrE-like cation transporter
MAMGAVALRSFSAVCGKFTAYSELGFPRMLLSWPYVGMLAALGLSSTFWTAALRRLPLNRAYPLMSLALVLNTIAARVIFDEALDWHQGIGLMIIIVGVATVASDVAASEAGPGHP